MRFKSFLTEDAGDKKVTVNLRPVTKEERRLIKEVREVAILLHDALKLGKSIKLEDIEQLLKDLKKHVTTCGFLEPSIKMIEKTLDAHGQMKRAPGIIADNADKLKTHAAELRKSIMSGDRNKGAKHNDELKKLISLFDKHVDAPEAVSRHLENRFTNTPTIFGTTRLIDELGERDYDFIRKLDANGDLFTFVDFPLKKLEHDFDYVIYFMVNLKTNDKPFTFEYSHEFRKFIRVKHSDDPVFHELIKMVHEYLHNNNKNLIPKIVEGIEQVPSIKDANDRAKKAIDTVYRGVGFGGDDDDEPVSREDIIEHDRHVRYVATSDSSYAAKNFALQKGHLEPESQRRSTVGYIIEYSVGPESILFDTKVIDTAYNESEIVIDATKAKVAGIKRV